MTEETKDIDFTNWRTFEHTGWERAAKAYDDTLGNVTRQGVGPLLDAARVAAGMQLLDVATGPGYAAAMAGGRGAHVIGVDFSEKMIERAWWQYPGIQFRKADAEALPFSDSVFDAVVSNFGLLHFGNPDRALSEARRVLLPGGRVAFTVWRTDDPNAGFGLIHSAIEQLGAGKPEMPDAPRNAPYARFADTDEASRSLASLGFDEIESTTIMLVWNLSGADELFEALLHGAVRTSALLRAQSPESSSAIRLRVSEALAPYRSSGTISFPMPALLTSASRR